MGSLMTFMILPSTSGPTGTYIGYPVSVTICPLVNPSVESSAIVRTVFPPICYDTSSSNLWVSPPTSSELSMGGNFSGKWTSTTAPIIYVIFL